MPRRVVDYPLAQKETGDPNRNKGHELDQIQRKLLFAG